MGATLGTFHQRVSRAIKRGRVFDGDIPGYAKDAVRTLEDLENWKHMWTEDFSQTLASGTNVITLDRVKSVRYLRFHPTSDIQYFNYMKKVSAEQIAWIDTNTAPAGFYMSGQNEITLDAKPGQNLTYDVGYYQYSQYDNNLPWLEIAENLLIAQTIVEMAPLLKDDRSSARWEKIVANRVAILVDAGLVHEWDGVEQRMIPYADEMDDWMLTGASTD